MVGSRRRWSELSPAQRAGLVVVGSLETVLTVASLIDLARRPAPLVRGPKAWWALGVFVQPVGPIAYLTLGRRTG